ncbi:MAG: hypothetical protein WCF20_08860 [Methylovirgula sp.]
MPLPYESQTPPRPEAPSEDKTKVPPLGRSTRMTPKTLAFGAIAAAHDVIRHFLIAEFGAREIRITKMVPVSPDLLRGWNVEAEMLVPDLAVRTLGLPLTQEVLEKQFCALILDPEMGVISFELFDPNDR